MLCGPTCGARPVRCLAPTLKLRVDDDFCYPDVLITCDKTDVDPYFVTRPSVIVEVLSPGTVVRDTREKPAPIYAGTGAVELSAIDLSVALDEIYRNVL